MKQYKVGVLGGTGMVGRRFVSLLERHPWFELSVVAASARSAGKTYGEAIAGRLAGASELLQKTKELPVWDAAADLEQIAERVDFLFSAVDMAQGEILRLEEAYAKRECPVVSNNGAHRATDDVPMVIPEINPEQLSVIASQRKRLGTTRGFIAAKSNCSLQSYLPALHPLRHFGLERVLVCTYQAVSGAGKTVETWPEMYDNVIPFIRGEEEKTEREPLKIWGTVQNGVVVPAKKPLISAQCVRVPVSDGHLAAVFAEFKDPPTPEKIKDCWRGYIGRPQALALPSAPKRFLHVFEEEDRPQTRLERDLERGMAVSVGRLRRDCQYDYKFIGLSHNTLRGAAGGAVLLAELLCAEGYME